MRDLDTEFEGGGGFGVIGLFIGPVVLAVAYTLLVDASSSPASPRALDDDQLAKLLGDPAPCFAAQEYHHFSRPD